MRRVAVASAGIFIAFTRFCELSASAADLVWEVESPFRLFKPTKSFALHEAAFKQVHGNPGTPPPSDIVWRIERRLNDPDCKDPSTPASCASTRRARFEQSRLGWAAQTIAAVCYESNGNPRRYPAQCERQYSWGKAKEDYVLPEAHTVNIALSPGQVVDGECTWSWQPRKAGGKAESRKLACKNKLTIARVPYSLDKAETGVAVSVKLPDGKEFNETVAVEDLFIVALGDSFASGESNPDRPVTFSAIREMFYDPVMEQQMAVNKKKQQPSNYAVANLGEAFDPKVLPRRKLEDEEKGLNFRSSSPEFKKAFEQRGARWFSADCHRSQYGYPFRVGLQLALENRHRSVTLVSLACSGAEVTEGLFLDMPSREGEAPTVRAQFDQLSDLICRGGNAARTVNAAYALPFYQAGSTGIETRSVAQRWCPPGQRKRPVDLMLMSIGGNDVGFGALALYAMTEGASDLAPIAGLIGSQIRFSPTVSRVYLAQIDKRMKAVKDALRDGFGVEPGRVLQTAYEPIDQDETGQSCGAQPTLGMDVHPKLKLNRERVAESAAFFRDFVKQLECTSSTSRRRDCPAGLATGTGTGFQLVTEHHAKFAKRGLCARNPKNALMDGLSMGMPRLSRASDEFKPYSPDAALPYAAKWRLFRTPNDAFLTANTHRAGISLFDIIQPVYAGLYSGAVHPTAEAHAIVADHVMNHARKVVDRRPNIEVTPVTTGVR